MVAGSELTMLIIDDDVRYVDSLFRDAQRVGIYMLHAASLEEGRYLFESPAGRSLAGVILDVECYRRKSDDVPDSSFIIAATKYFTERAPELPLVAITGVQPLFERYQRDFEGTWKVYRKGRDEAALLSWLCEQAEGLAWVTIVRRHPEIFRIVDAHLGADARIELLECLGAMTETSLPKVRGNLANLRSLQEKIYLALHQSRPDMIPRQCVVFTDRNGAVQSVNVAQILDHLKGNFDPKSQQNQGPVFLHYRSILFRFSELIYRVASDGIHAIDQDSPAKPTCYTVQTVTYALLDLILWFGGVVRQTRPSE
jgi:hypothetical protein